MIEDQLPKRYCSMLFASLRILQLHPPYFFSKNYLPKSSTFLQYDENQSKKRKLLKEIRLMGRGSFWLQIFFCLSLCNNSMMQISIMELQRKFIRHSSRLIIILCEWFQPDIFMDPRRQRFSEHSPEQNLSQS